jgi:hypothetical protein
MSRNLRISFWYGNRDCVFLSFFVLIANCSCKELAMSLAISSSLTPLTTASTPMRASAARAPAAAGVPADTVSLGTTETVAPTYSDPRTSAAVTSQSDLATQLEQSKQQTQAIINMIMPLMRAQGLNFAKVVSGTQQVHADATSIAKAKAAISEDGAYGVLQVASRILNFAKTAIGDDPTKLEKIREAVERGFKAASEALGGVLPDISQQTHDAISAAIDRWQSEGIPQGEVKLSASASPEVSTPAAA